MRCKNSALFVFLGVKVQLHEMQKWHSLCLFSIKGPVARDATVGSLCLFRFKGLVARDAKVPLSLSL